MGRGIYQIRLNPPTRAGMLKALRRRIRREGSNSVFADPRNSRVYGAEQYGWATCDSVFRNFNEVFQLITMVKRTKLWSDTWGEIPLRVKISSKGARLAWGGHGWDSRKKRDYPTLTLPYNAHGRALHTILHELAHCLVPRGCHHNARFCYKLLRLVEMFEGKYYATELRRRFIQTGALPRKKRKS